MKPIAGRRINVSTIATHMLRSSSVARMPMHRPAEPVMTPAERSNSPPIMSSATATAGIPYVDATSVQFAIPSSVPNRSVVTVKNSADHRLPPSTAPISGRRSRRVVRLTCARRSSTTFVVGGGGGSATVAGIGHFRLLLLGRGGGRPAVRVRPPLPYFIACLLRRASPPWPRSPCRRSPARSARGDRRPPCWRSCCRASGTRPAGSPGGTAAGRRRTRSRRP